MSRETRHEARLLRYYENFLEELRALRQLHAYQEERLYAQYKPGIDEAALRVADERIWHEKAED